MTDIQRKMFAEFQNKNVFETILQWGAAYIDASKERNVYPAKEALDQLIHFDEPLPDESSGTNEVLTHLNRYASPATVNQIAGRYFGFVDGGTVPAGLAAKLLGSFWDQNTAMYVMSPAAAKLEGVVEGWLKTLFHLPDETVAGFVSGSSMANLCALGAARFRLLQNQGWDINQKGLANAPSIRIIAGREAHSSILKTLHILGYGQDNIEFVETDDQGRIKAELIPEPDNKTLLILQAGNVNSGAFDDFKAICHKASKAGAWVHIDGAFGLWAGATRNLSYLTEGMEQASSWTADGHKTLNTPYDCGIILCRDKEALTASLHASAAYLATNGERDGMAFTPEMSRRARIFDLWATMKFLGKKGMDEMISGFHERALQFAAELQQIKGFHILNQVVFNQVVVACDSDEITSKVIREIQEQRICWVGSSAWQNKKVIRISVCSWATTEEDVQVSVESFKVALRKTLEQ